VRRAVALAALFAVGCGAARGGDPAAYRRDGEAICRDYQAAIDRLEQPQKLPEIGGYISRALPVLQRTVTRIERLDPPGDLREEFVRFRDASRATVARAEALRDAAGRADSAEVERLLAEASRAGRERGPLARAAGLAACAGV